jgi:hypothetical protein
MTMRFWLFIVALIWILPLAAQSAEANQLRVQIHSVEDSLYPDVDVFLTVASASGRAVSNLAPSMISGNYNGQAIQVTNLEDISASNQTRYVMLVLDLTSSVSGSYLEEQKETAQIIIDELDANDWVGVVIFDTDLARVLVQPTFDHGAVQNEIDTLAIVDGPSNTFHDGLYEALHSLESQSSPDIERVVVALTDVEDPQGSHSRDEVIQLATSLGVQMHMVGFGGTSSDLLDTYSLPTGGFTYLERERTRGDLQGLAEDVAGVISQEYRLSLRLDSVPATNNNASLSLTVDIGGGVRQTASTSVVARQRPLQVTFPSLSNGELVSGTVVFEPEIVYVDNQEVPELAQVDYMLVRPALPDEQLSPPNTANPVYHWDTSSLAGGDYTIRMTARDSVGNTGSTTVVLRIGRSLSVNISRLGGSELIEPISVDSGNVELEIEVDSDYALDGISLYVDGTLVAESSSTVPYILHWNTGSPTNVGLFNLRVVARDVNGVEAFQEIAVNVRIGIWATIIFFAVLLGVLAGIGLFIYFAIRNRNQHRRGQAQAPRIEIISEAAPVISAPAAMPLIGPPATLRVVSSPHFIQESFALNKELLKLGRAQAENDIVIGDPKISRNHAHIIVANGLVRYRDLNSPNFNPSYVNNVELRDTIILNHGDKIQLGDTVLEFVGS